MLFGHDEISCKENELIQRYNHEFLEGQIELDKISEGRMDKFRVEIDELKEEIERLKTANE